MKNSSLLTAVAATALLVACGDNRPPEEIVAERAQARWNALVASEFERAWEYYAPGFREQNSAGAFAAEMARRPIQWENAKVVGAECNENRCEVEITVDYEVTKAPGQLSGFQSTRTVTDIWINVNREWWYALR